MIHRKHQNGPKKIFSVAFFSFFAAGTSAIVILSAISLQNGMAQNAPSERIPFSLSHKDTGSLDRLNAIDMTYLNSAIAGAGGPVVARKGHFFEKDTGNRVRFFGVNLTSLANFPSHDDAKIMASHLAKRGFNIVRLHHMDNCWGNSLSTIWDTTYADRQHISAEQLDKLDYLVAQLKQRGIYVNINLHVSRQFSEADGFPESVKELGEGKGVSNFNTRMIVLQKKYARDLLTHVNPYTKLAYTADPVVAIVEINNENSLAYSSAKKTWLDELPESFRGDLQELWRAWLNKRNASNPLWPWMGNTDFPDSPGASKDWLAFTCEVETAYANDMRQFLKKDLHVQANIIDSQMNYGKTCSNIRESGMDFADDHGYWQHPTFPRKSWDRRNWSIKNTALSDALIAGKQDTVLGQLIANRVLNKPYSVSEYNHAAPSDFQCETVPILAEFAAAYDWDAIYLFEYGHYGENKPDGMIKGFFDIGNNPAKVAFLTFAALGFRKFGLPSCRANINSAERADKRIACFAKVSDPRTGMSCLSTAASGLQVIVGKIGKGVVNLNGCSYDFSNNACQFAALTLTALDGADVKQSGRLLLSVAGQVENTGQQWNAARNSVDNWGRSPTLVSIPRASISIPNGKIRHIYALSETGERKSAVPLRASAAATSFQISATDKTIWYELVK